MNPIKQAIQELAKDGKQRFGEAFEVVSVSDITTKGLVNVKDADGNKFDVLAMSDDENKTDAFLLVPKVGSFVMVNYTEVGGGYITAVSKVDKVYLKGDAFGGLIKIDEIITKLNNIENRLNLIGAWGATVTPALAGYTPLIPTLKAELENTNVKHG